MSLPIRVPLCLLLLAFSAPAACRQATSWVSSQWTPMAEENARAYQAADAGFRNSVEADYQKRIQEAKSDRAARNGGSPGGLAASNSSTPLPGGMAGPGEPRGTRKAAPPTITSLDKLLPPSLDFAAPPTGGLVLQRMRDTVVFGRTDDDALVLIPLSGEADLPHGMRGSIREEGDQLRLNVQMANGEAVEFRYRQDPQGSGLVMGVDIRIPGAVPGYDVEFTRLYKRAQVNVGEPGKAGQ